MKAIFFDIDGTLIDTLMGGLKFHQGWKEEFVICRMRGIMCLLRPGDRIHF